MQEVGLRVDVPLGKKVEQCLEHHGAHDQNAACGLDGKRSHKSHQHVDERVELPGQAACDLYHGVDRDEQEQAHLQVLAWRKLFAALRAKARNGPARKQHEPSSGCAQMFEAKLGLSEHAQHEQYHEARGQNETVGRSGGLTQRECGLYQRRHGARLVRSTAH